MANTCDEAKCTGDCSTCSAQDLTVTLTLDDDTQVECAIVGIYEVGKRQYIALLPLDKNGENQDGEVYLYRYETSPSGAPVLGNIESDEEYEAASEGFDEMLDSMEYDELVPEEEVDA